MSVKILVCQNSSCTSQGAAALVRDIEELAQGQCSVEEWGCLGKCGKGPNIEIQEGGSKKLKQGVNSFKKACNLVSDEGGASISSQVSKVGKMKYELRREADATKKMTMLKSAFDAVGGEKSRGDPALLASLFVIRSQMYIKEFMGSALKDAEMAVQLYPQSPQTHLAHAAALEACAKATDGVAAMQEAIKIGTGLNKGVVNRQMKRMERKASEDAENPDDTKARQEKALAAIAPAMSGASAKAKPKAKAKEKAKAKAKAAKADAKAEPKAEVKPEPVPETTTGGDGGGGSALPDWIDWKLTDIKKLNHDCILMVMESTEPEATAKHHFPHEDVWHVDFMKEEGDVVKRSYTPISTSADYKSGKLEFMIKIYPNGQMTSWLATLKVGDLLPVSSPAPTEKPEEFVETGMYMVAGGSAVTVAIQLCDAVLKQKPSGLPVHLALCNRTLEDVLYQDILSAMLDKYPGFEMVHCISQGKLPDPIPSGRAAWRSGRLNQESLKVVMGKDMKGVVSGPMGLCRWTLDLWTSLGRTEESLMILDELGPPQEKPPIETVTATEASAKANVEEPKAPEKEAEKAEAVSAPEPAEMQPAPAIPMKTAPPQQAPGGFFAFLTCCAPPSTSADESGAISATAVN